jgi:DNA invertase Pin-like site-specific DNA recombinase
MQTTALVPKQALLRVAVSAQQPDQITISSRKTSKQRRTDEVLERLGDSHTLVVTELSRLGRSTAEVIALNNELLARNIRVVIFKQKAYPSGSGGAIWSLAPAF